MTSRAQSLELADDKGWNVCSGKIVGSEKSATVDGSLIDDVLGYLYLVR